MATDGQCADEYQFKSPFLPGESCEAIYNKNTETRDKPGYYWILSRDYCGMTYTGSSCEDIYNKYPKTVGHFVPLWLEVMKWQNTCCFVHTVMAKILVHTIMAKYKIKKERVALLRML